MKKKDEPRNYLIIEEINQNEWMSKIYKKVYKDLNYIVHLLSLCSEVTGYVFISSFVSLIGIPIGITSFPTGSKICVITAGIEKYKSIVKKKKKKHNKILSLAKSKLSRNLKFYRFNWFDH